MISLTTREGGITMVTVAGEPGTPVGELGITGTGVARCRPGDLDVAATGEIIAMGRAITSLGQQLEAIGLESSVSEDDVDRVLSALAARAIGG